MLAVARLSPSPSVTVKVACVGATGLVVEVGGGERVAAVRLHLDDAGADADRLRVVGIGSVEDQRNAVDVRHGCAVGAGHEVERAGDYVAPSATFWDTSLLAVGASWSNVW